MGRLRRVHPEFEDRVSYDHIGHDGVCIIF